MSGWGNPLRLGEPEREGCIYLLRNLINGKGYVGKSIQKDIRWNVHRKAAFSGRSTLAIHRAIRKYGWNNFSAEVVYQCAESLLSEAETRFIKKLHTFIDDGQGYNLTLGGEGGALSNKTKRKMSRTQKRRCKDPTESRRRSSRALAHYASNPEARAKQGTYKKSPAGLSACARKMRKHWRDPEYRAGHGQSIKKYWDDPASHEKASAALIKRYSDPKEHEKSSLAMTKAFSSPEMRLQCSIVAIKSHARPEVRKRISERTIAALARPEVKAHRLANRAARLVAKKLLEGANAR
jgi:group I intron endonuclease